MNLRDVIAAAGVAAGGLTFMSQSGYAAIICDTEGDGWRSRQTYVNLPDVHVAVRPDTWT